jgi:methionyl aminopeptidase
MKPGMSFTIEPILAEGDNDIFIWPDEWTAATSDGSWSAQIEHQVLITEDGVEILTVLDE